MLVKSLRVTYLTGKGNNHLVPLLIPQDTIRALEKLCDENIRKQSGIKITNEYLFASARNSEDHISGWHTLHNVGERLPFKDPANMKATSNRHRISTIFAALEVPQSEREFFYKHMGNSAAINEQIYQAPLAMMEVTKIGKHLLNIDKGNVFEIYVWKICFSQYLSRRSGAFNILRFI